MNIKALTIALFTLFTFSTMAQETKPKVKELGINFHNFNSYGLQYKFGNEKRMWRLRLLTGGASVTNLNNQDPSVPSLSSRQINANLGVNFGIEKRKQLHQKLDFVYGIELSGNYNYQENQNYDNQYISTNIGLGFTGVIGVRYEINDYLFAGVELLPSIMFNNRTSKSSVSTDFPVSSNNITFGFGSSNALLSFGIKF